MKNEGKKSRLKKKTKNRIIKEGEGEKNGEGATLRLRSVQGGIRIPRSGYILMTPSVAS